MLSVLTGGNKDGKKTKKPSDRIIRNKKNLLKLLNEHLVYILDEEYPDNKSVLSSDFQIFLQFILISISVLSFYLTKKYDFEITKVLQWILVIVYFSINFSTYMYETYIYYYVDDKSILAYKNEEENISIKTKLDYDLDDKKWPSSFVINNKDKIEFKDIVDKDYKKVDYDLLKEKIFKTIINKKRQ
ncbi:hypothetical protein HANVADRAFT_84614 [Hanseniaspora valbyensis NRRL Y-1626]|uniref:Signal peptidase complex subunit 2 n=1 Tax=Hanseniaspora valbyensis NRRL Y-1626 TaxID=766949 RepID=A0A1B7TJS4_9ASCO|nr:hypothetical protein HANVADRAFT_84614 [Hanseniaspora valbyensis NRRL Y-1626]